MGPHIVGADAANRDIGAGRVEVARNRGARQDAEPAPLGQGRPIGAARWSGYKREPRLQAGSARSSGFGYFGRNQSDAP